MIDLNQAVSAALADPDNVEPIDAVGFAWLRQHAAELLEQERQRRHQAQKIAEAKAKVDELRKKVADAAGVLRDARARRAELEERLRRAWNTKEPAEVVAEIEAALARHRPVLLSAADEERRWRDELDQAQAELARLEAGS